MSLVVVGTGTEIGKTITCAILLTRYAGSNRLAYWKPIATGASEGRDAQVVQRLCGHRVDVLTECYLFSPPVSPHLAARQAQTQIDPRKVVKALRLHCRQARKRGLVIEGIGGLLVPLTDEGYLLADLLTEITLPCLLVASSTLGTINHTLLTLEALRSRNLQLVGVVLNGPLNRENRRAIERWGSVQIVGEIEPMSVLSRRYILRAASRFDPGSTLKPYLENASGNTLPGVSEPGH